MTPYELILMDAYLGEVFLDAVKVLKAKKDTPRNVTMQFLKLFEHRQYSNPAFVMELYEYLTVPKMRNYLIAGIRGK